MFVGAFVVALLLMRVLAYYSCSFWLGDCWAAVSWYAVSDSLSRLCMYALWALHCRLGTLTVSVLFIIIVDTLPKAHNPRRVTPLQENVINQAN